MIITEKLDWKLNDIGPKGITATREDKWNRYTACVNLYGSAKCAAYVVIKSIYNDSSHTEDLDNKNADFIDAMWWCEQTIAKRSKQ